MEWKSVILNEQNWFIKVLGEKALLLELVQPSPDTIDLIIRTVALLQERLSIPIVDLVPAYQSIALLFEKDSELYLEELEWSLLKLDQSSYQTVQHFKTHQIPVCYENGLDWKEVQEATQLSTKEIIEKHSTAKYRIAMTGFLPGFLYLSGMDPQLTCPRKENPRTKIPAGSVGIGGNQTGIYSLASPGGWQIIGQSPHSFFDANNPKSLFSLGDYITFLPIDSTQFERLKNEA